MTRLQHHITRLACLAVASVLAGCASDSPRLDAQWGRSTSEARTQQTAYPDAARTARGPIASPAVTSGLAIQRYHSTFENPPAPVNVLQLGVGAGSGAAR